MANAKITITGSLENGYKINDDKTVSAIIKCKTSEGVPKGLKQIGESIYSLNIAPKTWEKVSRNINKQTKLLIKGEQKASVNQKGTPYILVNVFEISLLDMQKDNTPKENNKTTELKTENNIYDKNMVVINNWYQQNEITEVKLSDIILTEDIHFKPKVVIRINDINEVTIKPITIRKLEDGKYTLVMGIRPYFNARAAGVEYIKAVITDKTHSELSEYLGICEDNRSWNKKYHAKE